MFDSMRQYSDNNSNILMYGPNLVSIAAVRMNIFIHDVSDKSRLRDLLLYVATSTNVIHSVQGAV